ncbi:BnaC01g41300D [Brassica napus]|uniref:BnaC01g41300D protein n=1 Tax=Brassica napus TaxID=3708 RepID=A0A078IR17_BRANA|nr:BnaC01g41300D [Brassica napus]
MASLLAKSNRFLTRPTEIPNSLCSLSFFRLISSNNEPDDFPPPSPSSPPSQSLVKSICSLVCHTYLRQTHVTLSPHRINLDLDANSLTHEQAITVVASLASEAGSMVALCFFHWSLGFEKFRHFMRLYLVTADSLIANGNLEKAHEVMRIKGCLQAR